MCIHSCSSGETELERISRNLFLTEVLSEVYVARIFSLLLYNRVELKEKISEFYNGSD